MSAATNTLTRTDQVLAVLRAGGRAELTGPRGLWTLYDAQGMQLPAWQHAIKAAARMHAAYIEGKKQ